MADLPNSVERKAEPFLKRIEGLHDSLASKRGEYMASCKPLRADIKEVYAEAKDAGVPAKALKGLVKYRELERKQKKIGDGLDIDEQYTYETLVEALGDFAGTPLGDAAVSAARPRRSRKEPDAAGIAAHIDAEADPHAAQKAVDAAAFDQPAEAAPAFAG